MRRNAGTQPVVTVSRRGAERIRAGHVWVYRSDVVEAKGISPGAIVLVQEQSSARPARSSDTRALNTVEGNVRVAPPGRPLGSAFYSTASEIAIRMISSRPLGNLDQLVRERIRAAIAYRERFVQDTNAYRVIFSEGDFLPGLIVDRYNDILSFQVLTQALDGSAMRAVFLSELQNALRPAAIVERVDPRVRKLEQLPDKDSGLLWKESGEAGPKLEVGATDVLPFPADGRDHPREAGTGRPALASQTTTEFQMNGVRFFFDALAGQKTGAFLDQRENYAAAAQYARGEALDVFCYQGGFALHLAKVCERVTGVDSSRPALELAERNARLAGREIEWIEANAFDLLRDYADSHKQYDCIVLDPPAFAKSRRDLPTALRGYKELNLRALKMLKSGGILVTCTCSYHVSPADLLEMLSSAAQDSHRTIRILENRGQSKDHPSVLGIPETAYLKCLIAAVS
jgi:23S rRNA (cytosine1962-C5)-methyltransferase